jgi:hypothetical protein
MCEGGEGRGVEGGRTEMRRSAREEVLRAVRAEMRRAAREEVLGWRGQRS